LNRACGSAFLEVKEAESAAQCLSIAFDHVQNSKKMDQDISKLLQQATHLMSHSAEQELQIIN
jgi:hypothetical protein